MGMRLAIVGSGYVGLVAAACLAELGHEVTCVDNDEQKVAALKRGESPIHEKFLPELLAKHGGKRLAFTTSLAEAVRGAKVVFIAVGTPPRENGEADLSTLEAVCNEIASDIDDYKVVVVKSTVPAGTNSWIARVLARCGAAREKFDVASNPEFLREGTAVTDFLYPDRIVLGSDSARAIKVLQDVYRPLSNGSYRRSSHAIPAPDNAAQAAKVIVGSARSAEIIKHASNAFLAMKISFINAVANICDTIGADIREVCEGIGSDQRIGPRFLQPGIGYGGSCFPKDITAFHSIAEEYGYDFRLLNEVIQINDDQRQMFLRKVRGALWTLKNKKLAVLGLAFKGGTDDVRESPAIALVRMLLKEQCEIIAYDPAAMERAKHEFTGEMKISFAESAYDAAKGADALLILTEWEEFAELDLKRVRAALKHPIVIDGRNLYEPEQMKRAGFNYMSVGRPDVMPSVFTQEIEIDAGELVKKKEAA